jgi:hypothetical protein
VGYLLPKKKFQNEWPELFQVVTFNEYNGVEAHQAKKRYSTTAAFGKAILQTRGNLAHCSGDCKLWQRTQIVLVCS